MKQPISRDFRSEKKILLADLASAAKITLTIREEKMKNKFQTENFFFKKSQIISEKSDFLEIFYFFQEIIL